MNEARGKDHDLIHVALAPYRLLCMGVSGAFGDSRHNLDNGMPFYVHYGLELLKWVLNKNLAIRAVALSAIFILSGGCHLVESVFGASLVPLLLFLAAIDHVIKRRNRNTKSKTL